MPSNTVSSWSREVGGSRSDPKVLHITEATGLTGGVKQLLLLMEKLRADDSGRHAILCQPNTQVAEVFKGSGFPVFTVSMFQDYDLIAAYKILRVIREQNFNVVHAHHPRAHALALVARHFKRFRLVVSRRVTHKIPWYPTSRWKYRSPKIDHYACVSQAVKGELERSGVAPDKLAVIPSSTDFNRFYPRQAKTINGNSLLFGVIGNYSAWKGQDLCLEAFGALGGAGNFRLLLAGRDTDGVELKEKIKVMGLETRVAALGWRDDVEEILGGLDALICPSLRGEGSSGAIREAFAMKIPVIASDIEANKELVNEQRGWLFKAGDASSLAAVITEFARTDSAQRQEKVENAYRFVRENFSVENMVQKTLAVYGVRP